LVFLFNGLGSSGKLILPPALAADAVDYDTMKTGAKEAGTHLALLNLANKATFALSVGISFPLLAFAGFNPTGQNSPDAISALMIIGTILPAGAVAVGIVIMWNFPLSKKRYSTVRRFLDRKNSLTANA
jgi:glycoside/pentoside/hexuronide:cation symporter, GPH family